jgi:hypothetical protein
MGWVSISDPATVAALLNMPPDIELIALLYMGSVLAFYENPCCKKSAGLSEPR